jgi:hypothetical protein
MNTYNNDIEMVMDFIKLSIISNDTNQIDEKRRDALVLQQNIINVLPVAQSDRMKNIYDMMGKLNQYNNDSTHSSLQFSSNSPVTVRLNRNTMTTPIVRVPISPHNYGSNMYKIEVDNNNILESHNQIHDRAIADVVNNNPANPVVIRTRSESPTMLHATNVSPVMQNHSPRREAPISTNRTIQNNDRFMVMIDDSQSHQRDLQEFRPIWEAYRDINTGSRSNPVIVRRYDLHEHDHLIRELEKKLSINREPGVYRVDLSSGRPKVVKFEQKQHPITLENLRRFSDF